MSSKALLDDPRDTSLEVRETLPPTWYRESAPDAMNTMGLFLSGLIVVTRNKILAWGAVLFALNGILNGHPMRSKEGITGWSTLLMCVSAFFASYFPLFIITKTAAT